MPNEVELNGGPQPQFATFVSILIDSGKAIEVKEIKKIFKCSDIIMPDGSRLKPIGCAILGLRVNRQYSTDTVKFLVLPGLSQDCILGTDGQVQFKVGIDWEHLIIRFNGESVAMDRSPAEARKRMFCLNSLKTISNKRDSVGEQYHAVIEPELYSDPLHDKYESEQLHNVGFGPCSSPADRQRVERLLSMRIYLIR